MRFEEMIFFSVLAFVGIISLLVLVRIILSKQREWKELKQWRENLSSGDFVLTRRGVVQVMGWVVTRKKKRNLLAYSKETGFFYIPCDEVYPK